MYGLKESEKCPDGYIADYKHNFFVQILIPVTTRRHRWTIQHHPPPSTLYNTT